MRCIRRNKYFNKNGNYLEKMGHDHNVNINISNQA